MNKIDVKCVALEGAIIPEYKTVGAAGADVYAFLKESVTLPVGKSCVIPTGVFRILFQSQCILRLVRDRRSLALCISC